MDLRRVDDLPDYVFDVVDGWKAEATARGADVVDFGIGSPDFETPPPLIERLRAEALDPSAHGYPTSAGLPELREALAAWYARRYGVTLDPASQTIVTWGASDGLAHLPQVLLGPGDTALVPEPCYPIHRYAVRFSGAEPIGVPVERADPDAPGEDDGALLERIERAFRGARPRPRAVLVSFPHNPTTRCVSPAFFEELVAFAHRSDVILLHDIAYADITFDGHRAPSILEAPGAMDVAVELVSLSKSHNMAGWRIGFVAGNARVVQGLRRLKSYLDYGVTKPIQAMALAALDDDETPALMAEHYRERRDLLCDGLNACGWPVRRPRGSMFVWAPLPPRLAGLGSLEAARRLLERADVAVSPGIGFTAGGEAARGTAADGHVRFALVQPPERIRTALDGIGRLIRAHG